MTFYFILCFSMYVHISFFVQGTVLHPQLCEKAGHLCHTTQINKYMSTSKKYHVQDSRYIFYKQFEILEK